MSFLETPRFPEEVSPWLIGGEEFKTDIVITQGGYEQRNQIWSLPLRRYGLSNALRTITNAQATKAFFRAVGGRANGFRVKDLFDYTVDQTTGALGMSAIGTGMPTYQLYKQYTSGSAVSVGKIVKPVSGQVAVYRNLGLVTVGGAAGNIAIDYTTGIITFVADASSASSTATPGATTSVTLTTNPGTLTGGQKLYLSGFTGTAAATLNGVAHTINSVSGTGPFVFTLATNTTGLTITGFGTGYKYPQAADALVWVGQFDIPVRFDMDWLQSGVDTGLMIWDNITIVELRI